MQVFDMYSQAFRILLAQARLHGSTLSTGLLDTASGTHVNCMHLGSRTTLANSTGSMDERLESLQIADADRQQQHQQPAEVAATAHGAQFLVC